MPVYYPPDLPQFEYIYIDAAIVAGATPIVWMGSTPNVNGLGTAGNPPAGARSTLRSRIRLRAIIVSTGTVGGNLSVLRGDGTSTYFGDLTFATAAAGLGSDIDAVLQDGIALRATGLTAGGYIAVVEYLGRA